MAERTRKEIVKKLISFYLDRAEDPVDATKFDNTMLDFFEIMYETDNEELLQFVNEKIYSLKKEVEGRQSICQQ